MVGLADHPLEQNLIRMQLTLDFILVAYLLFLVIANVLMPIHVWYRLLIYFSIYIFTLNVILISKLFTHFSFKFTLNK